MPDRRPVAMLLAALSCTPPDDTAADPPTFDPAADFSATRNPSGPWSWGYTATPDLDAELRLDESPAFVDPIAFWHPTAATDGYYPYVAANPGDATTTDATGGWALRPGQLALEAANDGRYAVVRFEAPRTGLYSMQVAFEGIHFGLSTTSVHVRLGDQPLFDALIDGYGGDPAFHAVEGDSPQAGWDGPVRLDEGDEVRFAVGVGANGTHFSDTTALAATLTFMAP